MAVGPRQPTTSPPSLLVFGTARIGPTTGRLNRDQGSNSLVPEIM